MIGPKHISYFWKKIKQCGTYASPAAWTSIQNSVSNAISGLCLVPTFLITPQEIFMTLNKSFFKGRRYASFIIFLDAR